MWTHLLLLSCGLGALAAHIYLSARHRWSSLALVLAMDAVVVTLWVAMDHDDLWSDWMREDAWVEWATVYAFLAATGVFAWRARAARGLDRFMLAGLALFCFFVAGEELSWGQRIFTFEPPEIFLEQNYQQELNVHNLLKDKDLAGFKLDSKYLVALIALAYGVLGAIFAAVFRAREWARTLGPPLVVAPLFGFVAWIELVYPVHLAGEAAEWVLGLAFLCDAFLRGAAPLRLHVLPVFSVALALVTAPLLDVLVFGSDDARVAQTRAELAELEVDTVAAVQDKLRRKGRVHKRVYTAIDVGYLAFGRDSTFLGGQPNPAEEDAADSRRDRRGYFLDPWNNPYWMLWDIDDDQVVLYSFGPNRRRDSDTKPWDGAGGDDIAVVIPVD